MADTKKDQTVDQTALLEAIHTLAAAVANQQNPNGQIAEAIDALRANAAPRQKTIDEVSVANPYNPTGNRNRTLPCKFIQNGVPVNIEVMLDDEIALLKYLKPGKYVNNMITVRESGVGEDRTMYVEWNKNDYTAIKTECRNMTGILTRCAEEAGQVIPS